LARGAKVLSRAFLPEAGEQSSRMIPAIKGVLSEAGTDRTALSGIVVGAGPGSFTGVRIAAATVKGLTHALGLPLWAFSSLAAGALSDLALPFGSGPLGWWQTQAADPAAASTRWVLFDARGERLYAACYRVSEAGLDRLVSGHATTVGALLERAAPAGAVFTGDGALRHHDRIAAAGGLVLGPPAGVPTADSLLHLLSLRPQVPPIVDVPRWEPEYLKTSSAERERAEAVDVERGAAATEPDAL
jgi:tRNA threonylcarbamoyl adenosine modification protein YeaZ